jgi:hypothetical protein
MCFDVSRIDHLCVCRSPVSGELPEQVFPDPAPRPARETVFSLVKRWSLGTYHALRRKHVDTHLEEFVFRYNRRFYRHVSFETMLGLAAHHEPVSYWDMAGRANPRKRKVDADPYGRRFGFGRLHGKQGLASRGLCRFRLRISAIRQGFWMITIISDAVLGCANRVSASPRDRA